MLKKEVRGHLLVTLIWLMVVTFLRWSWHWNLIELWLGGLIGTFFLDSDQLLYTLFIYPQEFTSQRVKRYLQLQQYKEALALLADTTNERTRMPFHGALFQLIFYVFCFWILTSTPNLFGKSLVMAMALHLLVDELEPLLKGKEERLRQWLFWQIKTEITFNKQKTFVFLMLLIFFGLNLLLI